MIIVPVYYPGSWHAYDNVALTEAETRQQKLDNRAKGFDRLARADWRRAASDMGRLKIGDPAWFVRRFNHLLPKRRVAA